MNRDVIVIAGGRFLAAVIALVSLRVSTTLLSVEEFGLMALMLGAQTFSTLIVINPIGQWLNRNTHGWWADGTLLLRLKYYPLPVLGAALVSASVFAVWQWRSLGNPEPIAFWVVFFAVIASVANGTLVPLLNMLGYRKLFVLLSNLSVGIGFLLAWLFSLESASAAMWLLGQSLGLILGAVLSWLFLLKQKMI